MMYLFRIIIAFLLLSGTAQAACPGTPADCYTESPSGTFTTIDSEYATVNATIGDMTAGETIVLADDASTWTSSLVVNKSLVMQGGTGTITYNIAADGYAIDFSPTVPSGTTFEMSGFTMSKTDGRWFRAANSSTSVTMTIIVYDNAIDFNSSGQDVQLKTEGGVVYGVIYDNTFTNCGGNDFDLLASGSDTWGNFFAEVGSANNLFIEDNIFTFAASQYAPIFSGQGMKGFVFRYNTVTQDGTQHLDMHGTKSTWGCGTMQAEIYGNKITNPRLFDFLEQRGGQAHVFYNALVSADSIRIELKTDDDDGGNCSHLDNPQDENVSNSYYWNQINDGGSGTMGVVENSASGILSENSEFWLRRTGTFDGSGDSGSGGGIGCGTLAERNAINMSGDPAGIAYWVTDQSCTDVSTMVGEQSTRTTEIDGYLSVWDGDSWEGPYDYDAEGYSASPYVPYTYPHPLRGETITQLSGGTITGGTLN